MQTAAQEPPPGPRTSAAAGHEDLLEALGPPIERPATTPLYRLSLALVAALMVALPLVYVALVALCAYGWWWYAVHGLSLIHI